MSKISPDEASAPAAIPRGVATGSPVPLRDWESRLREARAKREEALSLRRVDTLEETPAPVITPWPEPEPDTSPEDDDAATAPSHPGLLRQTVRATPAVLLVFSATTGLAFGTVIGLGVVFGAGQRPAGETATAPAPALSQSDTASLVMPGPEDAAATGVDTPTADADTGQMPAASYWTPVLYPADAHPMVANPPVAPRPDPETIITAAVLRPPARPQRDEVADPPLDVAVAPVTLAAAPAIFDTLDETAFLVPANTVDAATPVLPSSSGRLWSDEAVAPTTLAQPGDNDAVYVTQAGPGELGPEFFLHAPDGLTRSKLNAQVAQLEDSGVILAGIGREGFRVSQTHLRYYSPDTAAAAQAVAEKLGVEARDFTQGNSNNQRIEVWISGRPKAAPEEPKRTGFFSRLRDNLRNDR